MKGGFRSLFAVAAVAAGAGLGACGGGTDTLMLVDCSKSTADSSSAWSLQIASFAAQTWDEKGQPSLACFAGEKAHLDYAPGSMFPTAKQVTLDLDAPNSCKLANASAAKRTEEIEAFIKPRPDVEGSNWLGSLRIAAGTGGNTRIVVFSDFIQQTKEIDLTTPVPDESIRAAARKAAETMGDLSKLDVVLVGLGADTADTAATQRAQVLIEELERAVPFTPIKRLAAGGTYSFATAERRCGRENVIVKAPGR